ncbi:MAG TPA: hypothetical protein VGM39_24625 [Kofleriaceae bacterium]|jgi:hypothetical protein
MRTLSAATLVLGLLSLTVVGCENTDEDYKKEKPKEEVKSDQPAPPPPKAKKAPPPKDLGTCIISVTGDMQADQTTPGGKDATNVAYWYTETERKNMMGVDGYVVNCKGDKLKFALMPGGGKLDGMPFAPKKFTWAKGKSDSASLMFAIGSATLGDANGSVEVTALDLRHIAGTIDLEGKMVPGNKKVKVKGTFDLVCPGLSACDFGSAE